MPTLSGTVKNATGSFIQRLVRAYNRGTGAFAGYAISDPGTGAYSITTPTTDEHFVVLHDLETLGDPYLPNVVLGCHFDGQPYNGDPYRNNVVLNMRMNGTDGSTTIVDDTGRGTSVVGGAQLTTTTKKYGSAALYCNGSASGVRFPYTNQFDPATSDFTVELWVRVASYGTTASSCLVGTYSYGSVEGGTLNSGWVLSVSTTGILQFGWGNGGSWIPVVDSGTTAIGTGVFKHVALVKSGNVFTIYLDGVSVGSATYTTSITYAKTYLLVGARNDNGTYTAQVSLNGYIDDLRITKGVARYTSAFTPPTAEIPALSLRFPDVITGKTITANGDATISATQSKFGGYSAYFDGNGDYVYAPVSSDFDFGTGDFTVEAWLNVPNFSANYGFFSLGIYGSTGIVFYTDTAGKLSAYNAGAKRLTGTTTVPLNTWFHAAFVRISGVLYVYLNGVQDGSVAHTYNLSNATVGPVIGAGSNTGSPMDSHFLGYIDDIRITKGVGRYAANFTPPTAAFPETLATGGVENALIFDRVTPV